MTPTIIFDFDGTLALGSGPIVAFARTVAGATTDSSLAARTCAAIDAFERGETDYRDGYDVVSSLAREAGVAEEALSAAYGTSRALLGTSAAPVEPPQGLADFLTRLADRAHLVLATNAPGDGIRALLDQWGIAELFDSLHFTVGKPAGLVAIVTEALRAGPVLSIGDIAEFDLAPAAALGAQTALVGATAARSQFVATMRGRTITDLFSDIETWAASASLIPLPSSERHN